MHDVLAHSLSALALQLETRACSRAAVASTPRSPRAIDRAHHLAASGLDEARRAIAAARGDELPGPERIGALADAFREQSGLPVALEVSGEPRELAPEARLAVYRTAQEALTNVRRHAAAERVDVKLDYGPDSTVLVVEDHAVAGVLAAAGRSRRPAGYGLTGMRERAELLGGELLAAPTGAASASSCGPAGGGMIDAVRRPEPVRVLLADDQRLVRESLGTLLGLLDGIELVATGVRRRGGARAGRRARARRRADGPADAAPGRDRGDARLRERRPEVRVIALTTYADDESVLGALRAGARGYLTKDASGDDIRTAILTVAAGEAALDPSVQHHVVAALASDRERHALPDRGRTRSARRPHPARGRGARADRRRA